MSTERKILYPIPDKIEPGQYSARSFVRVSNESKNRHQLRDRLRNFSKRVLSIKRA